MLRRILQALGMSAALLFTQPVLSSEVGLGIILGSPTGISFKYGRDGKNSIDAALAWSSRHSLYLHGDYLWNYGKLFDVDGHPFDAYYGIGTRLRFWDKDHPRFDREDDDEVTFGARFPAGLRTLVLDKKVEIFSEISVVMDLIPSTDVDIGLGLGARYFF